MFILRSGGRLTAIRGVRKVRRVVVNDFGHGGQAEVGRVLVVARGVLREIALLHLTLLAVEADECGVRDFRRRVGLAGLWDETVFGLVTAILSSDGGIFGANGDIGKDGIVISIICRKLRGRNDAASQLLDVDARGHDHAV